MTGASGIFVEGEGRVHVDEVKTVVGEVLAPLLEADGGGVELVCMEGDEVTLRLVGASSVCVGSRYTQTGVIEPLIRAAVGRPVTLKIERAFARPKKRKG